MAWFRKSKSQKTPRGMLRTKKRLFKKAIEHMANWPFNGDTLKLMESLKALHQHRSSFSPEEKKHFETLFSVIAANILLRERETEKISALEYQDRRTEIIERLKIKFPLD